MRSRRTRDCATATKIQQVAGPWIEHFLSIRLVATARGVDIGYLGRSGRSGSIPTNCFGLDPVANLCCPFSLAVSHETISSSAELVDFCRRLQRGSYWNRYGIRLGRHLSAGVVSRSSGDARDARGHRSVSSRRHDAVLGDDCRRHAFDNRPRGPRGSELCPDGVRPAPRESVRYAIGGGVLQRGISIILRVGRDEVSRPPGRGRGSSGPIGVAGRSPKNKSITHSRTSGTCCRCTSRLAASCRSSIGSSGWGKKPNGGWRTFWMRA